MSISFSGLASGLDTTSWVESLVALKRAKVTTLQEQKEELVVSKDTLSSIKNFFNSFRTTIQRITKSHLNPITMNLFAQNIATSANLGVLTATATPDAEEGTYKVKVDKLASSTTATSGQKKKTTTTVTTTATEDTLLTNIGVKTGNIGVTVDGVKHDVAITAKDTIGSFIGKLQKIGVEASFNEDTGVFSMNLSASAIDDDMDATNGTNNDTGIIEKLHLTGVNEGYKTENQLKVEKEQAIIARSDDKLKDLGVTAGNVVIKANDDEYDVEIDDETSIGEFVQALRDNNIDATYDETTGVFTLNDAEIVDVGTTSNIKEKLGLHGEVYSKSQISKGLSLSTVVADTTSTLKDISDWSTIVGDQTVVVKNSSNEYTTITVNADTELGTLLEDISDAGLYATLNSDGTVEIVGGEITGGTFDLVDAFGLSTEPYTAMVTGNALTETTVEHKIVTLQTRLVEDLGVTKGYLEVTDADGNKYYEKIYSGQTIADFMADMGNLGIYTKLDENTGVLEITGGAFRTLDNLSDEVGSLISNGTIVETDAAYMQGTNLLECLYGSDVIATEQITVASTFSRTRSLTTTVTNFLNADLNTTLENLGLTTEGTAVFDFHGNEITIDVTKDLTIQALREKLSEKGISTEWDAVNSKLTINNATLVDGTSDLEDVLNLTEVISGKYVNSDAIYATTYQTIFVEPTTLLKDLGVIDGTPVSDTILYNEDGNTYTLNVDDTTSLQDLVDQINSHGVTASISSGKFVIENGYISNEALEEALGLETKITGESVVLSSQKVYTAEGATGDSTLGDIISALGAESEVAGGYNLSFKGTNIAVSADTTLNELFESITNAGGRAFLDSTGRVHIEGGELTGSVAEALGFTTQDVTTAVSATGNSITMLSTVVADSTSRIGDFTNVYNIDGEITADGVTGTVIGISTAQELEWLANQVNSGNNMSGKTFVLTKDIDLSGYSDWTPIGNSDYNNCWFSGTFDGNGYTISNLTQTLKIDPNATSNAYAGLFGVAVDATFKNIKLDNVDIIDTTTGASKTCYVGALVGVSARISLENIEVSNLDMQIQSNNGCIAGVAGRITGNSNISNIKASGTIVHTGSAGAVGGLFGELYDIPDTLEYCYSDVDITANSDYAGGIAAGLYTSNSVAAQYCANTGDIHNNDFCSGGLFGLLNLNTANIATTTVDNCYNLGSSSTSANYAADIYTRCHTPGTIVIDNCGGISGQAYRANINGTTNIGQYWTTENDIKANLNDAEHWDTTTGVPIPAAADLFIRNSSGEVVGRVNDTNDMTFGELFAELNNYGISADIQDGTIVLNSTNGNYITGATADALGITTSTTTQTETVGIVNTSSVAVTYTQTTVADETVTLEELGINSYFNTVVASKTAQTANGYRWVTTKEELYDALSNNQNVMLGADIDVSNWSSISEYSGQLDGNGYVLKNMSTSGGNCFINTLQDARIENLGIENADISTSSGGGGFLAMSANDSQIINCYVVDSTISGSITGGFVRDASDLTISNSNIYNSTVGHGGFVGILNSGFLNVDDSNIYNVTLNASGSVAGIVGDITSGTVNVSDTSIDVVADNTSTYFGIVACSSAGSAVRLNINNLVYSSRSDVKGTGKLYDGASHIYLTTTNVSSTSANSMSADGYSGISIYNTNSELVGVCTLSSDTTLGEILTTLAEYGISATINNGVISLNSTNGNYIAGPVAEALGITVGSSVTVEDGGTTYQSSVAVTYTQTTFVDYTTKLSELEHMSQAQAEAMGYTWVTTREELTNALTDSTASTKVMLGCDIALYGEEWSGIAQFMGEFDGNGYVLSGITQLGVTNGGLFISIHSGAVIKNLGIENANITATNNAGGIAGNASSGATIENCYVANSTIFTSGLGSTAGFCGGLVGFTPGGEVRLISCNSYDNYLFGKFVGGLVGGRDTSISGYTTITIKDSIAYSNSFVTVNQFSGGLVGAGGFAELNIYDSEVYTGGNASNPDGFVVGLVQNYHIDGITYDDPADMLWYADSIPPSKSHYLENLEEGTVNYVDGLINNKYIDIYDSNKTFLGTYTFNSENTLGDVINVLAGYGIAGTFVNGVLTLDSANGNYVKGSAVERLGIGTEAVTVTKTVGAEMTSTAAITYTEEVVADYSSKVRDYLYIHDGSITADGVTGDVIGISTAQELEWLANHVNSGNNMSGKTFVLTNDIDLSGYSNWTPIGNSFDFRFSGTFDGAGYTISNLKSALHTDDAFAHDGLSGLFGYVDSAELKNIKLDNVNITYNESDVFDYVAVGALAAQADNTVIKNIEITNLAIDLTLYVASQCYIGGVVGVFDGEIYNVRAQGTIETSSYVLNDNCYIGGLFGSVSSTKTLEYCHSDVNITDTIECTEFYIGGIAGELHSSATTSASYCTNNGNISSSTAEIGGIFGYFQGASYSSPLIQFSKNYGTFDDGGQIIGTLCDNYIDSMDLNACGGVNNRWFADFTNGGLITPTVYDYTIITAPITPTEPADLEIIDTNGVSVAKLVLDDFENLTFSELFSELEAYGINCTMNNGKISVESTNGNYVRGDIWSQLGFEEESTTVYTANAISSSTAVTYTETVYADSTDSIGDYIGGKYVIDGTITSTAVTGSVIGISTVADLQNLAKLVNNGNNMYGKTFVLTNDIDLSGISNWTSIGLENQVSNISRRFSGTFDGQGYTISNLTQNRSISSENTTVSRGGLFGYIYNAEIKNLTLQNINIESSNTDTSNQNDCSAALVGRARLSTISGITVDNVNINAGKNAFVGGIVGQGDQVTITNCTTSSGSISSKDFAGGILGYAPCWSDYFIEIDNCQNNANITSAYAAGGIVGHIVTNSTIKISNTLNKGAITATNTSTGKAAGIVGNLSNDTDSCTVTVTMTDSINCGSISVTGSATEASLINLTGSTPTASRANISNCYGYSTTTTSATNLINKTDGWAASGVVTESGCIVGSYSTIRSNARSAGYDWDKWSIGTSVANINLKTGDEYDIFVSGNSTYYGLIKEKIDLNADSSFMNLTQQLAEWGTVIFDNGEISYNLATTLMVSGTGTELLNTTLTKTITATMTSDTTFAELGVDNSIYYTSIRNNATGEIVNITINSATTLGDYKASLAVYGFDSLINNGKLFIGAGTGEYCIIGAETKLETALKIDFAENKSYMSQTVYSSTTESYKLINDFDIHMDSSTTFGELGIAGTYYTVTLRSGADYHTITVTSSKTVGDFMTELASYGVTTEISADGKFKVKADDDVYISYMSTQLKNALKLSSYTNQTTVTSTTYANTTSSVAIEATSTNTLSSSTTFRELGLAADGTMTINGVVHTIDADSTVGDLMTTLSGYGIVSSINDGKLIITDKEEKIQAFDATYSQALKLETIELPEVEREFYYNEVDNSVLEIETHNTLSSSTTIGSLHEGVAWTAQTIGIYSDGQNYTITVKDTHTVGDILTTLAGYGIQGSITDGKLTLSGDKEAYITNMTDQLRDALGLSDDFSESNNVSSTSNSNSNYLANTIEVAATRDTLLKDLCFEGGDTLADYNYELGISTESPDGNQLVTVTFTATSTLQDVIDKLAEYGIEANIDSAGNFAAHSFTLSDFELSKMGSLLMGGASVKTYQTAVVNNTSGILSDEKLMTDSTTLAELGITSGNVVIYKNGEKHTITVNDTQSVGDFRTQLGEYGISSSIIEGKLQLIANGVVYLEKPTGSGSNIVDVMGLGQDDWQKGDYSQSSDDLTVLKTVNSAATMDTLIKDLQDRDGNLLDITDGDIYVYQNGVRNTITIDKNESIRQLAEKLKNYGITLGVSADGSLYFDGNNNSYLTTEGMDSNDASNILEKLNISDNWETRYDSISETLDYELETDSTANGSTRLVDLQNEDGDSLGITTGTYYVYQNGVRNTETITADTTVNDFRATMAGYGLTTDFDENGQLSVGGYNETYLATSALAGDNTNAIDILFEEWNFVNVYTSNNLEIPEDVKVGISESTKLSEINYVVDETSKIGEIKKVTQAQAEAMGYTWVTTKAELEAVLDSATASTKIMLGSDIDIGEWNHQYSFMGEFDGNGYVLSNITQSGATLGGLFGSIRSGAVIKNLGIENANITATNNAGGIAGGTDGATIENCYVANSTISTSGLDSAQGFCGGLVGLTAGGDVTLKSCNSFANTLSGKYVGGLVAGKDTAIPGGATISIYDCSVFDNNVTATEASGGILGIGGFSELRLYNANISVETEDAVIAGVIQDAIIDGVTYEWLGGNVGNIFKENMPASMVYSVSNVVNGTVDSVAGFSNPKYIDIYDSSNTLIGTCTFNEESTLGDITTALEGYGITMSINNGVISLDSATGNYIKGSVADSLCLRYDSATGNYVTGLGELNDAYKPGYITVVKDGVKTNIEFTADDTVGDIIDELALYGFEAVVNSSGQLIIKNTGDSKLEAYTADPSKASNILDLLGIDSNNWVDTNAYAGTIVSSNTALDATPATRDTLLSELGVDTGEFYIYNNGVRYTAYISSDETVGSLMSTLESFGVQTSLVTSADGKSSILSIIGNGDSYVAKSNSTNASNVVEELFVAGVDTSYNYVSNAQKVSGIVAVDETTLLSEFDIAEDIPNGITGKKAEGNLVVNIDGDDNIIYITADDTFGSLIRKFEAIGLNATLSDGNLTIESGYNEITISPTSTSALLDTINLDYNADLGGYSSSALIVEDTQTVVEDKTLSAAEYADHTTTMDLLNISSGTLTIYRNGEKATIHVDKDNTFGNLNSLISAEFDDVLLGFEEGYLRIYSDDPTVTVEVGSTTDTSNFGAITGIANDGNGGAKSSRELYRVNSSSLVTTSGLFRKGNVTEGDFIIGDATFEITNTTKLSDLISQINASQDANATAYWDSIDGKLVIQSRTTGAALINIEAGSSNFTDILGFTTSGMEDTDGDGTPDEFVTRINTETQDVGDNARFSINGTYYTSTKNEIDSAVSRINGLTINLKGVSDSETTITVERDKETLANAVSDVVDAYNELIENIDKEIAKGQPLDDQSTLKLIRNQIRSLMTGSIAGANVFKNLDAVGISIEKASANNIDTSKINVLNFDKDKFIKAFDSDRDALKNLLVGTDANKGIFQRVEDVIEQAVTVGYFTSAEKSYNNQISRLDSKIEKAQRAVERYKEQLEAKFASMDLLISKMQNQYSSFLGV